MPEDSTPSEFLNFISVQNLTSSLPYEYDISTSTSMVIQYDSIALIHLGTLPDDPLAELCNGSNIL